MAAKLLYLDLLNDVPGPDAHCRVSVARCKPCTNPHDTTDLPRYLPAGLTQHVLNNHNSNLPPFHVTAGDVFVLVERLEVDKISSHRSVRGRDGASPFSTKDTGKPSCGNAKRTSSTLANTSSNIGPARPCNLDT